MITVLIVVTPRGCTKERRWLQPGPATADTTLHSADLQVKLTMKET
jgi:hypothetical protein